MASHKAPSGSRRNVLKTIGGLSVAGALAGCTGGGGGDGSGDTTESGGGSTTSEGGSGGGMESELSFDATMAIVAMEMSQIPSVTAMREMLPAASDDRFTGSVRTFSGSTLAIQAMVSGSVDYYALSPGNVVQAQLAGNDLRVIATKVKGSDYVFAVQPDINSIDQIVEEGRSVGIAGLGGASHMQVAGIFLEEGYDPDTEVNIQQLGGSSTRTAAVASGKIDATIIHLDQFAQIQNEGFEGKSLFEVREYFPNFINHTITVPGAYLEDETKRAHIEAYMTEFVKANKRATEDFGWLYEKTQKYQSETLPEEDAKETWELNANVLNAWPYKESDFTKEDYEKQLTVLVGAGVLSKEDREKVDIDALVDTEIYANAIANL
ncbi:ABC transporter substrate-binding protein [Haladaptatus sp. ZSTT2]|uniref:ABC transporter substrate-binding protein n=1 Tax=Haladaptatus sp. ZSTT2 TaxID=3120515 RepID=UPI00300F65CA